MGAIKTFALVCFLVLIFGTPTYAEHESKENNQEVNPTPELQVPNNYSRPPLLAECDLSERIFETVVGKSIASDLAGFYRKPIRMGGKDVDLAIGLNISNIGGKVSYTETVDRDFIPINMRFGTAIGTDIDDYNKISLAIDLNKLLVPTPPEYDNTDPNVIIAGMDPNVGVVTGMFQSFWDAPGGIKEEFREINYSFGSEYWYNDQFAIRTGYFFEHATKGGRKFFTFGSGVKYSAFILDFSYLISATTDAGATNPLANTMRFSMIWNFGAMKAIN